MDKRANNSWSTLTAANERIHKAGTQEDIYAATYRLIVFSENYRLGIANEKTEFIADGTKIFKI